MINLILWPISSWKYWSKHGYPVSSISSIITWTRSRSCCCLYMFRKKTSINRLTSNETLFFSIDSPIYLHGYSSYISCNIFVSEQELNDFVEWCFSRMSRLGDTVRKENYYLPLGLPLCATCNLLFIYRLLRFLPASKNIRIIVGTVVDQIRNEGRFMVYYS